MPGSVVSLLSALLSPLLPFADLSALSLYFRFHSLLPDSPPPPPGREYSRHELLSLCRTKLVRLPQGMPPFKAWFGSVHGLSLSLCYRSLRVEGSTYYSWNRARGRLDRRRKRTKQGMRRDVDLELNNLLNLALVPPFAFHLCTCWGIIEGLRSYEAPALVCARNQHRQERRRAPSSSHLLSPLPPLSPCSLVPSPLSRQSSALH